MSNFFPCAARRPPAVRRALTLALCWVTTAAVAQQSSSDSLVIRRLYDEALSNSRAYDHLRVLCKEIGPRLSGSANAQRAVVWGQQMLRTAGADTVWLQPCQVPHWERGEPEKARVLGVPTLRTPLRVCALGGSVGTQGALRAGVVEVSSFEELAALPDERVKGRFVFFNRPMEQRHVVTFTAYGGAVNQRGRGASEAAKKGAVGALVRSMSLTADGYPHTGAMRYAAGVPQVPAAALAVADANALSQALKTNPNLQFELRMACRSFPDAPGFNVVGEIRGSEKPNEVIVVGGHLDSWDLAEGAHDDGAGCVQSAEVLRLLKATGQRPARTVRAVLFANEENGTRGAQEYARQAELEQPARRHVAAIESDAGGFTPRGFSVEDNPAALARLRSWHPLLLPYGLGELTAGHAGTDIEPLGKIGTVRIGLNPDSQRYFDIHHAATDVFETVSRRELEMGAASMAALAWLISQYGLGL